MSDGVRGPAGVPAPGRPAGSGRSWRGSRAQQWLSTLARVGLGVVLVVAGWIKISNPDDAVRAVQAYQILPQGLTHLFGYGLPMLEILIGLLLVLGLGTRWAAVGAGVLMVVFIGGIVSVWVRGLSIDCGCFGGGGTVTAAGREARYATEIGRDLLFAALAVWTATFPLSRLSLDGLLRGPGRPADAYDSGDGGAPDGWDDDHPTSRRSQEHRA